MPSFTPWASTSWLSCPPPHGLPWTSMDFHGLPSVEHRWNIYRSKFHRAKCIKQHLSDKHPMKIHRTSNESPSIEHLSKLQRTSIQNLSNITREPNEPPIMQRKSKNRNASSSPPPIGPLAPAVFATLAVCARRTCDCGDTLSGSTTRG